MLETPWPARANVPANLCEGLVTYEGLALKAAEPSDRPIKNPRRRTNRVARATKCWISERYIGAGDNYGDAIVDAIESAEAMVLVFSVNANNSEEIKKEIALAGQRKITVIPVRLGAIASRFDLAQMPRRRREPRLRHPPDGERHSRDRAAPNPVIKRSSSA